MTKSPLTVYLSTGIISRPRVAELQCVWLVGGVWRASPAETGLFHWTMKPFCEPLSGHVHNAAVGGEGTGRSLITTVPRLPRVRNFQIQTYMHCFIYQFSVPPFIVAKELQAPDQKQINKQKIHVCMKGKFLCLSLLPPFELCSFIHSASSYSETHVC